MTSDTGVRNSITLLQGQGSATSIVFGNLLSLPYGNGLLYVQPVYIKLQQANPFPLMKLVLVSYGTQVGYAPTLQAAIKVMVDKTPAQGNTGNNNGNTGTPPGNNAGGTPQLTPALQAAAAKVDAAITKLQTAQRAGDFKAQGEALAELDTAMKEFQAAATAAGIPDATPPSPTTSPSPPG